MLINGENMKLLRSFNTASKFGGYFNISAPQIICT